MCLQPLGGGGVGTAEGAAVFVIAAVAAGRQVLALTAAGDGAAGGAAVISLLAAFAAQFFPNGAVGAGLPAIGFGDCGGRLAGLLQALGIIQKAFHRNVQMLGQRPEIFNVGDAKVRFPLGNGRTGDDQLLGQLLLGKASLFASFF